MAATRVRWPPRSPATESAAHRLPKWTSRTQVRRRAPREGSCRPRDAFAGLRRRLGAASRLGRLGARCGRGPVSRICRATGLQLRRRPDQARGPAATACRPEQPEAVDDTDVHERARRRRLCRHAGRNWRERRDADATAFRADRRRRCRGDRAGSHQHTHQRYPVVDPCNSTRKHRADLSDCHAEADAVPLDVAYPAAVVVPFSLSADTLDGHPAEPERLSARWAVTVERSCCARRGGAGRSVPGPRQGPPVRVGRWRG